MLAGIQQGWQQAAYCACPAGFDEVAAKLSWIEPGRIAIVPGLYCDHAGLAESPDLSTIPDVMRGEETQILGALQGLGMQDGLLVLPGTHSKWAHVRGGKIHHFSTFMTGEFYTLLRQHSILSRTLLTVENTADWPAFDQGSLCRSASGCPWTQAVSRRNDRPRRVESLAHRVACRDLVTARWRHHDEQSRCLLAGWGQRFWHRLCALPTRHDGSFSS
jgi:2-keto-3-deoxy-galactonokinase